MNPQSAPKLLRLIATLGLALALSLAVALSLSSPPIAKALPAGLPPHFAFGLAAPPGDTWMPQSGIAWDYRYQYLAGGVNTGSGWETWNSNGQFALYYAQESARHGYIPMLVYYELLQSSGSCGSCGEAQKDLTNLNTLSLMNAYFANFALLMKRLGPGTYDGIQGFGKTALINIEPDFSGGYAVQAININRCFGYCSGQGNDPSLLNAAVASSGFADVAAYPNTYLGMTQALAHLRDLYAPNVLLGYDLSSWATGDDIGLDASPTTDVGGLGQEVGLFLSKVGAHELLFNNPLDRDAGQYMVVYGQNRWWDRLNVSYPNFARWELYLNRALSADGNKPMLLWQVPIGNQYFDVENNTTGHFQDNRPEYIFGHIPELIQNGIVGAMFGAGNAGNTTYTDQDNDGVVNPPSMCTTNGISSGQICNTGVATVSDDDGGYLRMQGQSYYQHPVALGGGSGPTSTPTPQVIPTPTQTPVPSTYTTSATVSPASLVPGGVVTINVAVTSSQAASVLVDVEVNNGSGGKVFAQSWDNQAFGAGQTRTYSTSWTVPTGAATGTYIVKLGVFSPGWGTMYVWNNAAAGFFVSPAPLVCTPRPQVNVAVAPAAGALAVTVATTTTSGVPSNALVAIQLGNPAANPSVPTNALVDINGQVGLSGTATIAIPSNTSQLTFTVRRAASGQATTLPLIITDACGAWPTMVGAGASAF